MAVPNEHERKAIEQFLFNVTLPLLHGASEAGITLVGAGTLLSIGERCFLITAAHIFDGHHPEDLSFPETPFGNAPMKFGALELHMPDMAGLDVAVLELNDAVIIEHLKTNWHFASPASIAIPTDDEWVVLGGYPTALLDAHKGNLRGTLLVFYSTRIKEMPEDARPVPDAHIDLFYHCGLEAICGTEVVKVPALPGVSGASIWQLSEKDASIFWTPQSSLRIVGVQSAYLPGSYFRGINWHGVIQMFRKIDGSLADALETVDSV